MRNNLIKLMILFVVSLTAVSCSEDVIEEKPVEVTPINLHGQWKLEKIDGQDVPEKLYIYIDFNRKGTYKLYQNLDSMLPDYITGKFSVKDDLKIGYVLSGKYDFDKGNWNNEYIVSDLMKSGTMVWTVKDEKAEGSLGAEVQHFVRVDEIPADILEAGKYDDREN